ncbi:MAG: hypothetical protein KKA65_04375, partial [Nanoarchaeota archaeon]|nr:hypothetical protein [Nanoarchaeota archaeon]
LIQEAYRVLKPNGKIVISGPKPDYINNSNNVNNLIIHITEEFKNKGIEDLLKQDLKNFIDCSILLQKKGIQNVYEVEQITNILKSTRFKREIFASGEMYLGFCYQVILQK